MKIVFATFCSFILVLPLSAMQKSPTDYREVFTNQKLKQEFNNNQLPVIAAVIEKDSVKVDTLLKKRSPKVAIALANQLHQNVTYSHDRMECQSLPELQPLNTINPFFEALNIHQSSDLDCTTPFGLACFLGDTNTLQVLLKHHANINGSYGMSGYAPLHIAVKYNPTLIPQLLQWGSDKEIQTAGGDTPLMLACQKDGTPEAVRLLLAAGASCSAKIELYDGSGSNLITLTPLHIACNYGQMEKVQLLLKSGAPVDEPDTQGKTALHCAVMNMQDGAAQLLLDAGANIEARAADGTTVIEQISEPHRYLQAVNLLRQGAPYPTSETHRQLVTKGLDSQCSHYENPLLRNLIDSIICHNLNTFKNLIHNASRDQLNRSDSHRMTPLHWAVCRGNIPAVRELLALNTQEPSFWGTLRSLVVTPARPVNVNAEDRNKQTPLMIAARLGHRRIFDALIAAGVDPAMRDADNKSAADHARACGHAAIFGQL